MAKGKKTGGRSAGIPNKVTATCREMIAKFADEMSDHFVTWVKEVAAGGDPAKAADLYLRAIEYHVPKLARTTHEGNPDNPIQQKIQIEILK